MSDLVLCSCIRCHHRMMQLELELVLELGCIVVVLRIGLELHGILGLELELVLEHGILELVLVHGILGLELELVLEHGILGLVLELGLVGIVLVVLGECMMVVELERLVWVASSVSEIHQRLQRRRGQPIIRSFSVICKEKLLA